MIQQFPGYLFEENKKTLVQKDKSKQPVFIVALFTKKQRYGSNLAKSPLTIKKMYIHAKVYTCKGILVSHKKNEI